MSWAAAVGIVALIAFLATCVQGCAPDKCVTKVDKNALARLCLDCHADGLAAPGIEPVDTEEHAAFKFAVESFYTQKECK